MFYNSGRVETISPDQLNEKIEAADDFFLLDVRTPAEHAAQAIPGSYLIPLQELGNRLHELPMGKEIVVYCRVGNRSAYAVAFLARQAYTAKNLEGGIIQWTMAGHAPMSRA